MNPRYYAPKPGSHAEKAVDYLRDRKGEWVTAQDINNFIGREMKGLLCFLKPAIKVKLVLVRAINKRVHEYSYGTEITPPKPKVERDFDDAVDDSGIKRSYVCALSVPPLKKPGPSCVFELATWNNRSNT
jgi:hypothetical protein